MDKRQFLCFLLMLCLPILLALPASSQNAGSLPSEKALTWLQERVKTNGNVEFTQTLVMITSNVWIRWHHESPDLTYKGCHIEYDFTFNQVRYQGRMPGAAAAGPTEEVHTPEHEVFDLQKFSPKTTVQNWAAVLAERLKATHHGGNWYKVTAKSLDRNKIAELDFDSKDVAKQAARQLRDAIVACQRQ
jgi:Tfp pilus assembly protein PilX